MLNPQIEVDFSKTDETSGDEAQPHTAAADVVDPHERHPEELQKQKLLHTTTTTYTIVSVIAAIFAT